MQDERRGGRAVEEILVGMSDERLDTKNHDRCTIELSHELLFAYRPSCSLYYHAATSPRDLAIGCIRS